MKLVIGYFSSSATNIYVHAADETKLKTVQQWDGDHKQMDYDGNMIDENGKSRSINYSYNYELPLFSDVEWGVSLGIDVTDCVWGNVFYYWVDEKTGGN